MRALMDGCEHHGESAGDDGDGDGNVVEGKRNQVAGVERWGVRTSPASRSHAWPLLPATPNALRSSPNSNPNGFVAAFCGTHKRSRTIQCIQIVANAPTHRQRTPSSLATGAGDEKILRHVCLCVSETTPRARRPRQPWLVQRWQCPLTLVHLWHNSAHRSHHLFPSCATNSHLDPFAAICVLSRTSQPLVSVRCDSG